MFRKKQLFLEFLLSSTRAGEGLRITRPGGGGGHIMPPAISAPRRARKNTKLGGYSCIRTLSGANFVTLDQCFQGQMTSTMQDFRHFLFNLQGITLAGLAPKLRQIASNKKKKKKKNRGNAMKWAIWSKSQIWLQVNCSGARSQNVFGLCTIFQTLRFSIITSELFVLRKRIWHHRISLLEKNRVMPNFAQKIQF